MPTLSKAGIALLILAAVVVIAAVAIAVGKRKVGALRIRGIYPEEGNETDADVLRLLQSGEKIMAIRCYRELHKVGLKEAKDAVEHLEKQNA
jgi:ribosomal protein L7/L12